MPKVTKTKAKLNQEYIFEFGSEVLKTDGLVLRCISCVSPVQTNQRSQMALHHTTKIQGENIEIQQKLVQQLFITASFENQGKLSPDTGTGRIRRSGGRSYIFGLQFRGFEVRNQNPRKKWSSSY
jgi:hypothetical protein